ncbi:MAG: SulP family inorganic anion transporter [Cytophagales bacterium]|nr:MAG: SulP family inorganic anion transporter [Cytophagales bacterium]TAF60876.1 MAG: SulP family inorganic anion transporter [Cytophagales bacterium]
MSSNLNQQKNIPLDGLAGLRQNWRSDLVAGFVVFLIALPLSLGIAGASGVPPVAGLIAAICGGIIVSLFSGSFVTINGPAAGLIVIVLGVTEQLGDGDTSVGYPYMLAATVCAGGILVLLGLLKAGKVGDFFPLSVVHGMLAAIGLIIMSKQIHIALGVDPLGKQPVDLVLELPHSFSQMNPYVAIIGLVSIVLMILMNYVIKNPIIKKIPAPLLVVVVGITLAHFLKVGYEADLDPTLPGAYLGYYNFMGADYVTGQNFLVSIPEASQMIHFPDFGKLFTGLFIKCVFTIAIIQGLESLLSASAVEQLDPAQRKANLNKDLVAVGLGSVVAGALGGIPIIAEIVRSSANVSNGAKTRWANFFHGFFILICVLLIPNVLHMIPRACLAGILVMTGYRLASPHEFAHMYKVGLEQLFIFVITILGVLLTDLLKGIFIGIGIKMLINAIRSGMYNPIKMFTAQATLKQISEGNYTLKTSGILVFTNYLSFKSKIEAIPVGQTVRIDFSDATFIDHTVFANATRLKQDYNYAGGSMSFYGLEYFKPVSHHHQAARVRIRNIEQIAQSLTPRQRALAAFAEKNDYCYSFQAETPASFIQKMDFFQNRYIGLQENFVDAPLTKTSSVHLQSSDISYKNGENFQSVNRKFTAVVISQIAEKVPDFLLINEDNMQELMGAKPSKGQMIKGEKGTYWLFSDKMKEALAFIDREDVLFLEEAQVQLIEGYEHSIFINKNNTILDAESIADLFSKGQLFIKNITQHKRPQATNLSKA